jgi:putative addiction module component (TIGR02574 family)
MDTLTVRQKLFEYIRTADDEKVEAIYTLIKDDANGRYEWWNDEELVAELDLRSDDLKSGKVKGIPWEDVKSRLLSSRTEK